MPQRRQAVRQRKRDISQGRISTSTTWSAFGQNGAFAELKSAAEKGWERSWAKLIGIYEVSTSLANS